MSPRLSFLFRCSVITLTAGATLLAVSPVSKTNAAVARATKQSEDIVRYIDGLLGARLNPEPLPRVVPNPFVVVSSTAVAPAAEESGRKETTDTTASHAGEFPAFTNAELLARCVATLKIGGVLRRDDRVEVVINNIARREGDALTLTQGKSVLLVRIVRINASTVTLRLNDAEQDVSY